MKKILSLIICVFLLIGAFACSIAPTDAPPKNDAPISEKTVEPAPEKSEDTALIPTEDELEAMLPFMDSILLASGESGLSGHSADNTEYFWTMMYYLCVNYADMLGGKIDNEIGEVSYSADDLKGFASVMFSDFKDLPEFPFNFESIMYDEPSEEYQFMMSDRSESYPKITDVKTTGGTVNVTVSMFAMEDNEPYASAVFKVAENKNDPSGKYPFTIEAVEY